MASSVLVLSRAGRASVPPGRLTRLESYAHVRFEASHVAPPRARAVQLLQGVRVLGATNVALPDLDRELLAACPELRAVVLYATGHDHVDVGLLDRHGVTLTVLPDYATQAVAEHALAMMLALTSRIHLANDRSRGIVPPDVSLRGVELGGRTVGVIGLGRIGRRLATMLPGLGLRVIGTDLDPLALVRAREAGVVTMGCDDLLAAADVVVVCASTLPGTPAILDARRISLLRDGAFVVCVSRPSRVALDPLAAALRSGAVRGYAVDEVVLDPVAHADLAAEGRVVQTAHSAWWRDEVLVRGAEMFGAALEDAALGRPRDLVSAGREHAGRVA